MENLIGKVIAGQLNSYYYYAGGYYYAGYLCCNRIGNTFPNGSLIRKVPRTRVKV